MKNMELHDMKNLFDWGERKKSSISIKTGVGRNNTLTQQTMTERTSRQQQKQVIIKQAPLAINKPDNRVKFIASCPLQMSQIFLHIYIPNISNNHTYSKKLQPANFLLYSRILLQQLCPCPGFRDTELGKEPATG